MRCAGHDHSEGPVPQTSTANSAIQILQRWGELLEDYLRRCLSAQRDAPARLLQAIEYSLLGGGKRLRPALVFESCAACDPASSPAENPSALAAAAAIELIHTFSLVHDDLPAMDDDDLRRGRPTSHKVFGQAMAILAGDAMVTMAFELLARQGAPALVPALVAELAAASGPAGMIGGQVLDIESQGRSCTLDELKQIHRRKTGALLTAPLRMGAITAGATPAQFSALSDFGRHLGLAFQIVDDILDVTSTPQELGKATNKDRARGKNTYPALLGLEASQRAADEQLAAALASLNEFGVEADGLRALARFVVQRRH
jgi:geranylgeranyl diphosphate synthase type II